MPSESASSPASAIAALVARFADVRMWTVAVDSLAEVPAPGWVRAAAPEAAWAGAPVLADHDRFHAVACLEQAARRGYAEAEVALGDDEHRSLVAALDLRPDEDVLVVVAGTPTSPAGTQEPSPGGVDEVTGLLDRQGLEDRLRALPDGRGTGLVLARIDGLTEAAASADQADAILLTLADRLRSRLAQQGWLARIGLDTFALLMSDELSATAADDVVETIASAVRQPLAMPSGDYHLAATVGWVGDSGTSPGPTLLYDADLALREAERRGAGRAVAYSDRLRRRTVRRLRLRHDLPSALVRDELFLDFQPIHDLHELRPVGAEALMRWQHPTYGLLRPADFIPLAEESGIIADLGWWLADQAVRALVAMRTSFSTTNDFYVAINVSGRQLNDDRLVRDLDRVIELHGVEPGSVVVELTETALLAGEKGVDALLRVADRGCQIAIDDFGAGFASLDYLSRLPVTSVKLHPSFVSRVDQPRVAKLVTAMLELCRQVGVSVTAEGIESSRQLRQVRDLGIAVGQGYVLGRPAALDSLIGEDAAAGVTRPRSGPAVLVP